MLGADYMFLNCRLQPKSVEQPHLVNYLFKFMFINLLGLSTGWVIVIVLGVDYLIFNCRTAEAEVSGATQSRQRSWFFCASVSP